MNPYDHAVSSVNQWGGRPEDYLPIHNWFDIESKSYTGDWTHRALRHHAAGVMWAVKEFGDFIVNSDGERVPTRKIAEQHVVEDCGFIPTVERWLEVLRKHPEPWMLRVKVTRTQVFRVEKSDDKKVETFSTAVEEGEYSD